MRYIYGPINSRRLGLSLGITLTPSKVCSFDCIYCQLGKTTIKTTDIKDYIPFNDILAELKSWIQNNSQQVDKINYITFSGSGEPTLNSEISQVIAEIKKIVSIPVCVITNASLLILPAVRKAISLADLLIPSLDAVYPRIFQKINRPLETIKIEDIIEGLISLRKEFRGRIWLEVMLVKGVNDDIRHIKKLKEVIDKINPDKIQLNSPVRATCEPGVLAVEKNKLEKIKEILGDRCEIL